MPRRYRRVAPAAKAGALPAPAVWVIVLLAASARATRVARTRLMICWPRPA